ncbi:homeodomain-interacting protein kinase 2-like isoform X2 [Notolabrus celidotus]|uniref:homeodomain-interacting protein kinase 2-like isoform X2 n=1 Tax=Notolabrus celidotus TaxID=1203425 RepID=UPI001490229D|nr:homeodomain-interacting protein kinase 2-like isoform X2 [Notolabrus celidotus]
MVLPVPVGGRISSSSTHYEVQALLGSGSFGDVARCKIVDTNKTVALKVQQMWAPLVLAEDELATLKTMKELGSDKYNIVRWNEAFTFFGLICLEFEILDISLRDFLNKRRYRPLGLMEIRPIIQQLATALDFLKGAGIVHADLKPSNIMMVEHEQQPLKIKVIDFGQSLKDPADHTGSVLTTLWYRAPEMLLGAPFNEAIDVWSLGCTAAEIMMNSVLFRGFDEYDMIRHIYYTVGKAPEHMLCSGMYTKDYHTYSYTAKGEPVWIFPSSLVARNYPHTLNKLSDLLTYKVSRELSGEDLQADECDRVVFVDLLTKTLKVDGAERLTPSEILQHPFITMSHLVGTFEHSSYVKKGMELITICKNVNCDDEETSNFTAGSAHHGGPEEGHPAELDHLITGENSSNKRKRDGEDDKEHGKRSKNTTPENKQQRTESEKGEQIDTGEKACSSKSLQHKRKRDDADDATQHEGPKEGENSSNKRKRDGEDGKEHGKRSPNTTPENKRMRTESEKGAQVEKGDKACSSQPLLLKRKRDDTDEGTAFDYSSPSNKRGDVSLSQDLMDSIKYTGAIGSYFTRVSQPQKRERDEEETADSMRVKSSTMRRVAEEGAKSADGYCLAKHRRHNCPFSLTK